jgi:hypothetical protein
MAAIPGLRRRRGAARDAAAIDPGRMLRRRRGPVQVALGVVLVMLVLAVEGLLLRAYAGISDTTQRFGDSSYLTGNLVNTQRETLLLTVELERARATGDLTRVDLRRALLQN